MQAYLVQRNLTFLVDELIFLHLDSVSKLPKLFVVYHNSSMSVVGVISSLIVLCIMPPFSLRIWFCYAIRVSDEVEMMMWKFFCGVRI